ncbi:MAG: hypothetical protein ACQCN4_02895 [Candidatus Bathyarchaeia archaeon]|jgi:predicted transcriptional regulator
MALSAFKITPQELILFHHCLCSKICIRIFKTLQLSKNLNVSAIARKAGCNNDRCIEHLKQMENLVIVEEEFYAGRHTFSLRKGEFTDLMAQAISLLEMEEIDGKKNKEDFGPHPR